MRPAEPSSGMDYWLHWDSKYHYSQDHTNPLQKTIFLSSFLYCNSLIRISRTDCPQFVRQPVYPYNLSSTKYKAHYSWPKNTLFQSKDQPNRFHPAQSLKWTPLQMILKFLCCRFSSIVPIECIQRQPGDFETGSKTHSLSSEIIRLTLTCLIRNFCFALVDWITVQGSHCHYC